MYTLFFTRPTLALPAFYRVAYYARVLPWAELGWSASCIQPGPRRTHGTGTLPVACCRSGRAASSGRVAVPRKVARAMPAGAYQVPALPNGYLASDVAPPFLRKPNPSPPPLLII